MSLDTAGTSARATSRSVFWTGAGATHNRAKVPVKSNPAAILAATKWVSTASGVFCAKAPAVHKIEKMAAGLFKASSIL